MNNLVPSDSAIKTLQFKTFQNQVAAGSQKRTVKSAGVQPQHGSATRRGLQMEGTIEKDRPANKGSVAPDFDRVAVGCDQHRLGQSIELALGAASAAENHERAASPWIVALATPDLPSKRTFTTCLSPREMLTRSRSSATGWPSLLACT